MFNRGNGVKSFIFFHFLTYNGGVNLFVQLFLGSMMIGLTVAVHALALDWIVRLSRSIGIFSRSLSRRFRKPLNVGGIVLCVFGVHVAIIWLWAIVYMVRGCAPLVTLEDALYFSTITYTTLGYGDIILDSPCRMMSGVEAANGFILFGWTAAFIFEIVSQIYRREVEKL